MKKTIITSIAAVFLSVSAFAQGAGMRQMKNIDGKDYVAVTNPVTLVNTEAAARRAGDAGLTNYALTTATALVSAEATERIAGDSTSISFTSATSNALAAATASLVASEASARRAGDAASTNFTLSVSNSLNTSIVSLVNAEASARRAGDAASTNFTLSVSNRLSLSTSALVDTRVPTNRTITIGSQVGSLQTNLVFTSTGAGVTEPTVTNIAQAVVDANVPTLSNVLSVSQNAGGQSITNLASLRLRGNVESLVYARNTSSNIISPTSFGNIQLGFLGALGGGSGYIDLRAHTYGCIIAGYITGTSIVDWPNSGVMQLGINEGYRFVGSGSHGSMQIGYLGSYEDDDENLIPAYQTIGNSSPGAWQVGYNLGTMAIGNSSPAAMQIMSTDFGSSASNNAPAALQISVLESGQHALTTTDGAASLLIGAGTISNKNTIVVGDNEYSHGQGSVTAGGGFFGSGIGITINGTNIQDAINQRVEKSNGTATNLSVFSSLTLFGKAIINGDTLIGAGGVTNAIIANLETIVKDVVISTNVVRVVSTQSVYVATVTSPCVITQDVSALTLATNQTAFWTTRINVTDWSATNGITFATNIAAYAGDFTVIGCYDFACSLLCDGRIEMRQTFPTVERSTVTHWNMLNTSTSTELAQLFITASVRTNSVGTYRSRSSDYIISTFTFMGPALTNISSSKLSARALNLAAYTGANYVLPQPRSTASGYIMRVNCSSGNFATDGFSNSRFGASSGYSVGLEISVPVGTGDIYLTGCEQRKMNELEIRAYNNGWRPQ